MSIVVWDGKTLAADKQGTCGDMCITSSKMLTKMTGSGLVVCAWTGTASFGKQLATWYFGGAYVESYPEFQKDKEDWCRLIVADGAGCKYYERTPFPIMVEDPFMAWGSGRDFAMGALLMGANAIKAVEVANYCCVTCGLGVEAYDIINKD